MTSTMTAAVPCLVKGCPGDLTCHGLCCQSCWDRLPEGLARVLGGQLDKHAKAGTARLPDAMQDLVGHVLARLGAELAGPLTEEQLALADALTPRCHTFTKFADFFECNDTYFPKLRCASSSSKESIGARNREFLSWSCQLTDLYDQAMAARGDKRRAVRLGVCEF